MKERLDSVTSDDDIDEVLKIALRNQGRTDPGLHDRLMTTAHELGISETEVLEAEREYSRSKKERGEFLEFKRRQVREFREHFFVYIVVNTLLVVINILTVQTVSWAIWPILGWGIGLAFHAWGSLNTGSESFQEEFAAFRKRKERRRKREDDDD